MSQLDESIDNFTPLTRKKLAGSLLPSCGSDPSGEILEGRNLYYRGQLRLDLFPPLVEDTGIVLGAAMTPEDAALEQPGAFNRLKHFPEGNLGGRPAQGVASSGATERAD